MLKKSAIWKDIEKKGEMEFFSYSFLLSPYFCPERKTVCALEITGSLPSMCELVFLITFFGKRSAVTLQVF
jgi:hypothetical protein